MTAEQRSSAIGYLGDGAQLREAAHLVHAAWKDFSADWSAGRADSERGSDIETARWYRDAQAARSRKRATLRTIAAESAGTRESQDTLRVLEALQTEEEPDAVENSGFDPV